MPKHKTFIKAPYASSTSQESKKNKMLSNIQPYAYPHFRLPYGEGKIFEDFVNWFLDETWGWKYPQEINKLKITNL